jgi:hypothetical protein
MRFTPNSDTVVQAMLDSIGLQNLEQLFDDIPGKYYHIHLLFFYGLQDLIYLPMSISGNRNFQFSSPLPPGLCIS